jgi:DNA-binding CsgD family transcriptional regulator
MPKSKLVTNRVKGGGVSLKGALRLRRLVASASPSELEGTAFRISRELGFRYFIYCGHFSQSRRTCQEIRFDNVPAAWIGHCRERGLDLLPSPLRQVALQEVTPVAWEKVAGRNRKAFDTAASFGLVGGITHCVHGPRGQWSLSSFVLDYDGPAADRFVLTALPDCHLIACAIHHAASRMVRSEFEFASSAKRPLAGPCRDLSDRERQCLIRSAQGSTTSEIGRALKISERTVVFHLANVRRKLEATNSRHAVTKALSLKLIGEN